MIETECQQLVVDAVVSIGGNAIKMNNRFIIGVPDLLIKLPGNLQAFMLEAKKHDFAASIRDDHVFDLEVTKLQRDNLRDWQRAGMPTGVVSFIQYKRQDVRSLRMAIYRYGDLPRLDWRGTVGDHLSLGGKDERYASAMAQLLGFING